MVADEVRKLAERSSVATKEIASLVNGTQAGVREAVHAMQQGSKEVEVGYKLAMDAGGALDDILTRSQNVKKQVAEISVASQALKDLGREMVGDDTEDQQDRGGERGGDGGNDGQFQRRLESSRGDGRRG